MAYNYEELMNWNRQVGAYPLAQAEGGGPCDYHRLQIERWLWDSRIHMAQPIVDIGAEWRRWYMGKHYFTLNASVGYNVPWGKVRTDVLGNLLSLPLADKSIGTILCTEVFEHVPNLFRAAMEIKRVLWPGGTAYLSSPFIWPTHDTEEYGDYWRITEQGWRFMFHEFDAVRVTPIEMRREARFLWHHLASWQVMGVGWECGAPTGYMVEARR